MGGRTFGLLFVHGMGQQKRWEHLRASVRDFAELTRGAQPEAQISVSDRTGGWKASPDDIGTDGPAPMTLSVVRSGQYTQFECHEVYWADLGTPSGLFDTIGFWIWGLGQWGAPIYRVLDPTGSAASDIAILPESVAGRWFREPLARFTLAVAGLAALFALITLSLAKRLLASLLAAAPSPTLIVQFVGDVRLYEQRPSPGRSAPGDPGQPLRVPIRRRMVGEMVAMHLRDYPDGWFVVAHSLGSVVAYNGLTEISHALPNYLSRELWQRVPPPLRRDEGAWPQEAAKLPRMMPARQPWLHYEDAIDRRALFSKLKGVLTYGNPLGKFAALWPRIVATANDRKDGTDKVFRRDCHWINLKAPDDPVSGMLQGFSAEALRANAGLPPPQSFRTAAQGWFGLAHIRYFISRERFHARQDAVGQRHAVVRWLLSGGGTPSVPAAWRWWNWPLARLGDSVALVLLWGFAAALIAYAPDALALLFGTDDVRAFESVGAATAAFRAALGPTLGLGGTLVALAGIWRWWREAWLNARLADSDDKPVPVRALLWGQALLGMAFAAVAFVALPTLLLRDFSPRFTCLISGCPVLRDIALPVAHGWQAALVSAIAVALAIVGQTFINVRAKERT